MTTPEEVLYYYRALFSFIAPITKSTVKMECYTNLQAMGYIKNASLVVKLNVSGKRWPFMLWKCPFLLWKVINCMSNGILSMFCAFHGENTVLRTPRNWKRPCFLQQDPFTRTLYENEKITFWFNNTAKVGARFHVEKILLWTCTKLWSCPQQAVVGQKKRSRWGALGILIKEFL